MEKPVAIRLAPCVYMQIKITWVKPKGVIVKPIRNRKDFSIIGKPRIERTVDSSESFG